MTCPLPPPPKFNAERTQPRMLFLRDVFLVPCLPHRLGRGQVPIDRVTLPRKLR